MNERDHQAFNGQFDEALLTAYALGELEGVELALVEAALQSSPEACRAVDEIRAVAGYLREAAGEDEHFAPSVSLRQQIESRLDRLAPRPSAGPADRRDRTGPSRRRPWVILALASVAVLLLAVAVPSLPMFQRGAPTEVAIRPSSPDHNESSREAVAEAEVAEVDHAATVSSAPLPAETLSRGTAEQSKKAAGEAIVGYPAASGPAAPQPGELPIGSAGAYARDLDKGSSPGAGAARMLKAPPGGQPADASTQEPALDASRGRGAEPRIALGELRREAGAAGARTKQSERYGEAGLPAAERPQERPPASPAPTTPGDRLAQNNRPARAGMESAGRPLAPAEPAPAYSVAPKTAASPAPAAEVQPLQDSLDVVVIRKPQTKQEPAKPAAISLGVSEFKSVPQQMKVAADPYSAGASRPMLRGDVSGGSQAAQSLSAQPPAAGPVAGKDGREAQSVVADESIAGKRQPAAGQAAPAASPAAPALVEGRAGGLAYGQAMGGGYGGFGGAGYGDRAKEAKEDAYFFQAERPNAGYDAEQYESPVENSFQSPAVEPESTVSIDVDTASYANVRRLLQNNQVPPPGAVRIEEMVNYFPYDYPRPKPDQPFAVDMEAAGCPWNGNNRLVRVALKAKEIDPAQRGPSNLVFLIDVSGSMRDANKLPLVKDAMAMLVDQLTEDDRVSIVTYAGEAGLALEPTEGTRRKQILERIEALQAGGSTHGSAGIQMAYDQALAHFVPGGNNRVILCTDGDLNVGITDDDALVKLIEEKASSGVFLTVVGFGAGNLKDAKLEKLADKGNGTYAYVDGLREARKVFIEQVSSRLVTVAKDVKVQIEFNPTEVAGYRLLGYENRLLASKDFSDDVKDAGEMGAGDSVTFLYEIVPLRGNRPEAAGPVQRHANLRYQRLAGNELTPEAESGELLALKLRYKLPDEQQSRLLELAFKDDGKSFGQASKEFRFAAAVASFGLLLRGSQYNQGLSFTAVEEFAAGAADRDPMGLRSEFVDLVRQARNLYGESPPAAASVAAPGMQPADRAPAPK